MLTVIEQGRIKSGEFTFCSRCGRIVRYGNGEFMCTGCTVALFGHAGPRGESLLAKGYEQKISDLIYSHRAALASLRLR